MSVSLYELLDRGIEPRDFLGRLSPTVRLSVSNSWEWKARPGQRWVPGPERITDHQCGRGFGKNRLGSEAIADAAKDPERWGGGALIGGVTPTQVRRDCLTGPAGLFAVALRRAQTGNGPGIRSKNMNDRELVFEAVRGGGSGLRVKWAASSDPKSFRGMEVGLAWLDEYGVWYHAKKDEQGTNGWEALEPGAMRAGPDPKIIITQTPSRALQVRELQRDAERPECPTCQATYLEEKGEWKGEPGSEPWRLPSSPREKVHPLLWTRSTEPVRVCPVCGTTVIARVRLVTGSTLDNPHLAASMRAAAKRKLASGTAASRAEFDPQGEQDQAPSGALVRDVLHIEVMAPEDHQDRWTAALQELGIERGVVFVDPAVTSGPSSDDTGVVAAGLRRIHDPDHTWEQVIGLEDATVIPEDVVGAPSTVWAPKAVWLALRWGFDRIVVEANQGGEEVVASVRGQLARPMTENELLTKLSEELGRPALVRGLPSLVPTARRMLDLYPRIRVETVHRRSNKATRFSWYGELAARKEQALACFTWLEGPRHWHSMLAQAQNYEPDQAKGKDKKDRFDALVAAAQVLLGVREVKGSLQGPQGTSWMYQAPSLLG